MMEIPRVHRVYLSLGVTPECQRHVTRRANKKSLSSQVRISHDRLFTDEVVCVQ